MPNKHSEETRKKMSESHTGKQLSEETKSKISESMQQYWQDRKAVEAAMIRAGFPPQKRHLSEETKEKMRKAAQDRQLTPQAKEALKKYQEERKQNAKLKQQLDNEQKGIH